MALVVVLVLGVAGFTVVLGAALRAVVVLGAVLRAAAVVDGAVLVGVVGVVGVDRTGAVVPAVVPVDAALVAGMAALMAMLVPSAVATPMLSEAANARPRGAAWGRRPR